MILLAQQRDPLSLQINTDLGFHYYYTGRYADAAKQLKLVLEMGPGFPPAHLWLGRTSKRLVSLTMRLPNFAASMSASASGRSRSRQEDTLLACPGVTRKLSKHSRSLSGYRTAVL